MRVLGLDPAAVCGVAHSDGLYVTWCLTDSKDKHPGRRLERFRRLLYTNRRELGIDAIGFEDAAFGSNNLHTAAMHNELKGVIKLVAAEWDIPCFGWKPNHLKKWLTGSGKATKQNMIDAVRSNFGVNVIDHNIADAIAVMERTKFELLQTECVS